MSQPDVDIDCMTPGERLELLGRLWDSLSQEPESIALTEGQRRELDRRIEEMDQGLEDDLSWDDVVKRIRQRPS